MKKCLLPSKKFPAKNGLLRGVQKRVPFRRSHLFSLKWLLAPSRDVFVSSELPTQLSPSKQQLIGPFTKWSVLIARRIFIFLNNFLSKNTYFEALVLFHRYMMYYYTMFFKKFDFIDPDWTEIFGSKIKNLQKMTKFWGRKLWAWYAPSAIKKVPTSPELDHYFSNKNFQRSKNCIFTRNWKFFSKIFQKFRWFEIWIIHFQILKPIYNMKNYRRISGKGSWHTAWQRISSLSEIYYLLKIYYDFFHKIPFIYM